MSNHGTFSRFWWLMKLQRMVFSLCWRFFLLTYFCIGVGALSLIFLIEARFFLQITHNPTLSYVIAGIFECAKVGTSSIKQALAIARKVSRVRVSALLQGLTAIFQAALIVLSLICTIMVVTTYLDGTYELGSRQPNASDSPHAMVASAVNILQESIGITVKASVCISVFALLISALLQGTIYIVFGHVLATQASEIEHIFMVKLERAETKKNCTSST
jgi:hypothetical protein